MKPSPVVPTQIASIEVTGPDTINVGQSAQFVARIRQLDGTTKEATSMPNLRWISSNPFVITVNPSGMVTAARESGEAVITAQMLPSGASQNNAIQGTRRVAIRPDVTAELELTQEGAQGQLSYVFNVKLSEFAGVPATVTDVLIYFDEGWGHWCTWTAENLAQTRLPANGTLALEPLTCGNPYEDVWDVLVEIGFTNEKRKGNRVYIYRQLR